MAGAIVGSGARLGSGADHGATLPARKPALGGGQAAAVRSGRKRIARSPPCWP